MSLELEIVQDYQPDEPVWEESLPLKKIAISLMQQSIDGLHRANAKYALMIYTAIAIANDIPCKVDEKNVKLITKNHCQLRQIRIGFINAISNN